MSILEGLAAEAIRARRGAVRHLIRAGQRKEAKSAADRGPQVLEGGDADR